MNKLLVPTDFTRQSQHSIRFAVDFARLQGGMVYALHVIELPGVPESAFGLLPIRRDPALVENAVHAAELAFEGIRKSLPSDVPIQFHAISQSVTKGIEQYIREHQIDAVVMSTHGEDDLDDVFVGSTAERVIRTCPVPVFTVPREIALDTINDIVLPTTLEQEHPDFIDRIKELQRMFQAKLHVLCVNTPQLFRNDQQMKTALEEFAETHQLTNYTLNSRNHQFEGVGIAEFAREINAGMIGMATRGRSGLSYFFKGSIAGKVSLGVDGVLWTCNIRGLQQL